MSEGLKKYLWLLFKICFSGGAIYLVFRNAEVQKAMALLASQNFTLVIAAFLLYLFSKYITAERFRLLLEQTGISLSVLGNGKLYLLGMYYNLFLPGGVSGDAYKAYYLNKEFKKDYKELIKLTLLDRIGGVVAIGALLLFFGAFLFPLKVSPVFIISIPILGMAYYFILQNYFSDYVKAFWKTNFQSLAGQLVQVLAMILLLISLGVKELFLEYSIVFLISSVVAALPLTIGGIGARELTFIYGAKFLFLDPVAALSASVIFYLITVLSSFLGMPFSFSTKKILARKVD